MKAVLATLAAMATPCFGFTAMLNPNSCDQSCDIMSKMGCDSSCDVQRGTSCDTGCDQSCDFFNVFSCDGSCDDSCNAMYKAASSPTSTTLLSIAVKTKDLSTLVQAVTKAGLAGVFSKATNHLTLFAPTNAAFASLPSGALNHLLQPAQKAQLVNILKYHVVAGVHDSKSLKNGQVGTLAGRPVRVRITGGKVLINTAQVIKADIKASNGIAHVINKVLIPPTGSRPTSGSTSCDSGCDSSCENSSCDIFNVFSCDSKSCDASCNQSCDSTGPNKGRPTRGSRTKNPNHPTRPAFRTRPSGMGTVDGNTEHKKTHGF